MIALHNEFVQGEIPNEMPFKELVTIGLNSTNVGEIKGIGQVRRQLFWLLRLALITNHHSVNALHCIY